MTEPSPISEDVMDAPADRFCDVVMEGGVTSGIIYASAVVELARHYRFRNIGGSSIGAFAAALAAAAEYRRRRGYGDGFAGLANVPTELAQVEEGSDRRTRLERLFNPQEKTRRLFNIFLSMLERKGFLCAGLCGLATALCQYIAFVVSVALVLLVFVLVGPLSATVLCRDEHALAECGVLLFSWSSAVVLAFLVAAVLGIVIGIAWDLGSGVVANGFGLCRGWSADERAGSQDLAMFLHYSIQTLAGRALDKEPLTFRDLWEAPGSPMQALQLPDKSELAARSINLEVYASNLAHGRPYRFPLDVRDDMGRLFFRREELEEYFPKGLVDYLAAMSKPYEPRSDEDPPGRPGWEGYLELPAADLPIVVAARLAMSFPVLISAVPLYAIVHGKHPRLEKCWMSDGGLCSNFPIHLFDSFLPMWPTFGISLSSRHSEQQSPVWLPEFHNEGRGDLWDHGPEKSRFRFGAFLASIWKTTWRWNDTTMMRMPGVRDRVVRIYLEAGEGGVNIRMPAERISKLGSKYGTPAGRAFIRKFQAPGSPGWNEHRWVRLQCLLVALRERMRMFSNATEIDHHTTPIADQIAAALASPPLRKPPHRTKPWPSEAQLPPEDAAQVWALVDALRFLEQAFLSAGDHEIYRALPRPSLRMRHPT